jgi:hypothetical protein
MLDKIYFVVGDEKKPPLHLKKVHNNSGNLWENIFDIEKSICFYLPPTSEKDAGKLFEKLY